MWDFGEASSAADVRNARAREIVALLNADRAPFFKLVGVYLKGHLDVLLVEIELGVAQRPAVDIRPVERIAVVFDADEDLRPEFIPARSDFPKDQLHVMVGGQDFPPTLCIWFAPFDELRANLTPIGLLEALKRWLECAAAGTLHDPDQPVEPLLRNAAGTLILPGLPPAGRTPHVVPTRLTERPSGRFVLRLEDPKGPREAQEVRFCIFSALVGPVAQQATGLAPRNLAELAEVLDGGEEPLKDRIASWATELGANQNRQGLHPIFLLNVQKWTTEACECTQNEYWAFYCNEPIEAVAETLGLVARVPGSRHFGKLLGANPAPEQLAAIQIDPLTVHFEVGSEELAGFSGEDGADRTKILAIGVGALGSTVFLASARAGFGEWTLVDSDIFLPHNTARHILGDAFVAERKVHGVRGFAHWLMPRTGLAKAIDCDVSAPGDAGEELNNAFDDASVVLDMSASVTAARAVAEHPSSARRLSAFLNPAGTDLVMLGEDQDRSIDLWDLEADYYAQIASEEVFEGHLAGVTGTTRYGNGCRDVSVHMSGDDVSLLASIASRQLRARVRSPGSFAAVWRYERESGNVRSFELATSSSVRLDLGHWKVRFSCRLLRQLAAARAQALPAETGGALFGIVDRTHKRVCIAAALPAPPDSEHRPTCFVRGTHRLSEDARSLSDRSLGQLRYVGEWHSHPDGAPAKPSLTDNNMFDELCGYFASSGEPVCMAILARNELFLRMSFNDEMSEGVVSVD